jgi:glycosyltransferase involved in cell wall biosynthesis
VRVLFVAMSHTVHTARWIAQLEGQGFDIHLFAVGHGAPHPELRGVTLHPLLSAPTRPDRNLKQTGLSWPFRRGLSFSVNALETKLPSLAPARRLARLIRHLKPTLIHVLHMQHAGYLTLSALSQLKASEIPRVAYSSWGSDMYYYGNKLDHAPKIRAFLARADFYIADCKRDVKLAQEFGFRGQTMGVFPVGGGYDLAKERRGVSAGASSARRVIALKGYHQDTWAGRALVGLHAIMLCSELLTGYEIAIFSATPNTRYAAEFVARVTGLNISILPDLSHEEMLKLMGRSRASLGLSITDGTPNAMLEAMIMGALPIQSDTVSTAEWITDGENGLLVPAEDAVAVAAALRRALTDDALIDRASRLNEALTTERLAREDLREQVLDVYSHMTSGVSGSLA